MVSPAHTTSHHACPLCRSSATDPWHQDKNRPYFHCNRCDLVFVPESSHLSHSAEKAIYDQHENNAQDEGYRRFLSRMADPIKQRIPTGQQGLDFGSGPGPVLALMLEEAGYEMAIFDIYFANRPEVLEQRYDFITSTEVFEHLSDPGAILEQLLGILKPGGYLGIMTKRVTDLDAFTRWHYKNDPTHITFFSEACFHWIARHYQLTLEIISPDVVLLKKQDASDASNKTG